MIETYTKGKETKHIAGLKPQFKDVIIALNERAIANGYMEITVELRKDTVADPRYAYQSRGWEFCFRFEKEGQKTTFENWGLTAPAFKRGKLSGKPIRIEIPTPDEESEWKCKYEFI